MIHFKSNQSNLDSSKLCLLFIHGNSMNSTTFDYQLNSALLKDYQCIALDLPGHGASEKLESYSIKKLSESVKKEFEDYDKIILVGHSLGGQLCIHLLQEFKDKCVGVIICSAPPLKAALDLEEAYNINETSLNLLKGELSEKDIQDLMEFLYPEKSEWNEILYKSIKETDKNFRPTYGQSLNCVEFTNEIEILKSFSGKKLMIAGETDRLLNNKYLIEVAEEIGVPLEVLANCGHFPQLEKPETFNEIIAEFLKKFN